MLGPVPATCRCASESRNSRISPHMPPWRPGAPSTIASASSRSCAARSAGCETASSGLAQAAELSGFMDVASNQIASALQQSSDTTWRLNVSRRPANGRASPARSSGEQVTHGALPAAPDPRLHKRCTTVRCAMGHAPARSPRARPGRPRRTQPGRRPSRGRARATPSPPRQGPAAARCSVRKTHGLPSKAAAPLGLLLHLIYSLKRGTVAAQNLAGGRPKGRTPRHGPD